MKLKFTLIALVAMLSSFAFTANAQTAVSSFDELKAALANSTDIVVNGDIAVDEAITIPSGTTVAGDGTLHVQTKVYVVSTENPYPGVTYNKTATKNGSISGTASCAVVYEISLDGGENWFTDTTNGKAQAVTVKKDGTKTISTSFQSAFTSAKCGEVVHMLKDAHVQSTNTSKNNGPLRSYYGLILEGNGHTIYTDVESSGAHKEYSTIKFTSYLAGTGADVRPVLKNVTIDSQKNAKADLDIVSGDVTFTVSLFNVNLLNNTANATLSFLSGTSVVINKSNVKLFDSSIPAWDAGSANAIEFYSGDYSLSFNGKCKVYGGSFSKDATNYLAERAEMSNVNNKYVVTCKEEKVEAVPSVGTAVEGEVANEIVANEAVANNSVELPADVANFTVQLTAVESENEATTKVTFTVTPSNVLGEKVSTPTEAITFRLPVPAAWSGKAKVYHNGAELGVYDINEENSAKYVEVTSANFSEFAVEAFDPAAGKVAKIGENYYATLSEAFAAVTDDNQTVVLLADVTENLAGAYLRGNITTENGATVTVNLTNSDWVYCPYTFVIGENVTLNVPALFYYAGGSVINGTVVAGAYYQRYGGTKLTINEPGSMTVTGETCIIRLTDGDANAGIYVNGDNNNETVGLNLSVAYFYQGMIYAKDANIKTAVYWQTNETDGQGSANLVLDNSTLNVTVNEHDFMATGNSTVTLTNSSSIVIAGAFKTGENTEVSVDATSTIKDKNGVVAFITGEGTETNPYIIDNAAELVLFRNSVNAGETKYSAKGVYVALGADIDLAGENWVGIGSMTAAHGFMGNFDGAGYTISNLTITNPALDSDGYAYAGLFALTEGTDKNNQNFVKNLTIENVTIKTTGHIAAAAIAYAYYTVVENVKVCGNIAIEGGDYTAGVLAYTRRCVNASNISIIGNENSYVKGAQVVGGVISDIQMNGGLKAEYSNFSAEGITVSGTKNVGGISGIIATQTLNGAAVKNVALNCDNAQVGIVAGCLGGTSTISNVTYENVTGATALIGATYDGAKAVVAKIGDTYYSTLIEAVAAVEDGGTVTLIADEIFTATNYSDNGGWKDGLYYVGDKSFTIDLGGFTIGQNGDLNDYLMNFKNVGSKANTITIKNGTLDAGTTAFCALCTSSSHENQLTINTEKLNIINNISNGSTVKVRGGAVLNVNDGTVITGKNSYLGIECIASTVNINDGAEIYMNGTSSYNGCMVGVGGNGVINVYGGYGKGVKGGFIAMTSGGTINVAGGEWIANTDGSVGNNSNLYVLTAQSNSQESGFAGGSYINVTGGSFRGGMDAWVLDASKPEEKAGLNISGGNFNANPTNYVVKGYIAKEENGIYTVKEQLLEGEGTEANPYLINNVDDLVFFRNSVNAGETKYNAEGVYVALGANIDLKDIDWSVNIGDDCAVTFDGVFDGKDFTISNLTATETAKKGDGYICTGLFGAIYGNAVVKNLTIENVTIDAQYAGNNVSAVVGFAYNATGSIENVKVIGDININAPLATGVGAIVGYDYYSPALTVKNSVVKGNDGSAIVGKSYTGGLVGYASSKIAMNNNTVENISITATGSVGAVAGIMLAGGSAADNTVKNVTLSATGELWANSAAVVAGTITDGSVTVSNTTVEIVTANGAEASIVGGILVEKPTTAIAKVEARIGDVYYTTLAKATAAAQAGETIVLIADAEVVADETITLNGVNLSTLEGVTLTNNGTVEVKGEVSLDIATLAGSSIDFLDGAIVKNSTIGGNVFVAGNVTFRGANTFAMLYDYGTLTDYYGTTAPMKWTVEEGASVTLTNAARYGLGYGDDVTVYGNIENALTARENLTDADRSLFMHGMVAQESKGWNCDSKFTVENAYVAIGSNNSFGNKSGNYGGTYTFNIKNSVVDASRITFYEALSTTTFTFDGCDVKMGTFMTRDADSKFILKNSKILSTTASNGTDEGNYNKGELTLENSTLTYSAEFKHEAGVINLDLNSLITAPKISGVGTIKVDATGVMEEVVVIAGDMSAFTGTIEVVDGDYKITDAGLVVYNASYISEYTIDDTNSVDFTNDAEKTVGTLTYKRTLAENVWNPLYLPFEISVEELVDNYDIAYYNQMISIDTDNDGAFDDYEMEVAYITTGTLRANYPYFIRPKSADDCELEYVANDVTLYPAYEKKIVTSSVANIFTLSGTHKAMSVSDLDGCYAVSADGWAPSTSGIKAHRLYLKIEENDNSPFATTRAKSIRIVVAGEGTTGVEGVKTENAEVEAIYDLSGRRVLEAEKGGIYIVNGVKTLVK